jgi:hypothetical protein
MAPITNAYTSPNEQLQMSTDSKPSIQDESIRHTERTRNSNPVDTLWLSKSRSIAATFGGS